MAFDLKTAKPVSGGFDLRSAKPVSEQEKKKKPEETGFLRDLGDVGISLGLSTINLVKPFAYMAQRNLTTSFVPSLLTAGLGKAEELLKGGRSEADIQREQARQRTVTEEAKAPGQFARGLVGAREFLQGPKLPEKEEFPLQRTLGNIAGYLSPTRVISSLLPETPEAAQKEISNVTSQFGSPIEVAQFVASQAPATLATIYAGGVRKAGALAEGLELAAAKQLGERAAVRSGIVLNSTDAGYSAAQDVLDKGGSQQDADRAFAVAAGGAAIASAVAAKIPGLEQNIFSSKQLTPGIIRGAVRSAVGEAPQEFVEESGSRLAQNIGKLGTVAQTDLSEGVLSSGVLGAIGGAGIGAGGGALQAFLERGTTTAAPPAGGSVTPPPAGAPPVRTATISFPNRADPSSPITRTIDVFSEQPDEEGYIKVRDDTGRTFEMKAADLDELEAASPAFQEGLGAEEKAAPTVDRANITERLRIASGTPEGKKPAGRVIGLANDVATALEADDPVAAQRAVQSRINALANSRMSDTTKAQRQAEIDEAQSIINDYRVEYGRARAEAPARVETPPVQSESVEQAIEQNRLLAEQDAAAEAARTESERARLERESALESASLVGQGSPIRQAQTERQQIFDAIINDDTIENPAAAFRQQLRERGYPNAELTEAERRQVQARRAFTKPAALVPFTGEAAPEVVEPEIIEPTAETEEAPIEGEFTEVPAPLPAAPPEVVAGAAVAAPSRRAQLMAGAAEPGVPAVAFGEEPAAAEAPAPTTPPLAAAAEIEGDQTDLAARQLDIARQTGSSNAILAEVAAGEGELADVAARLLKVAQDFPVQVLTREEFDARFPDEAGAQGVWNPSDGTIYLSDDMTVDHVPVHEIVHGILQQHIDGNTEEGRELAQIYNDFKALAPDSESYGFTNAQEFVAEALGSRSFRNEIRSLTPEPGTPSILDRLKALFRKVVGRIFKGNRSDVGAVTDYLERVMLLTEAAARKPAPKVTEERLPIYAGRSITRARVLGGAVEAKIIRQNLEAAEQMEAAGSSGDEIRVATGWERNPYDNEWRYIQADDMARASPILEDFVSDYDSASDAYNMTLNGDGSFDLGDLMRHSELYSIYPEARNIHVFLYKSGGGELQGSFDPDDKSINLYADARDPLGTLLHEVQHWVQDKEGFAFGSSPSTVWNALTDKQKRFEADTAVDVLNGDLDDLSQVLDVMSYLNSDPDFRAAIEDGTAMQDLDGFFGKAFDDGVIVDDRIYGLVQERLEDIVNDQAALGLSDPSLTTENVLDELNSISEEVDEKTQLIEDIKNGDPTEEGSPAEEAARTAFEDHTRRNVIRYIDTAGEIEARDVAAQRGKRREELLATGMLKSEKAPRPGAAVISRRAQGPSASIAPQPNAPADPEPVKLSRIRQAINRLRTSAAYSNIASQFSGIQAADNWRARSYGVKALPESDSFYNGFETYLSKKNGKMMQFRREYVDPIDDAVSDAINKGVTLDDINDALQARGAAERNAGIAEINKNMPDGGSGITDAAAEAMLRDLQLSGKMRYIDKVLRLHDRLRDKTQQMMVEDGLVSAETMADWKRKYPNYTPYKGWAPSGDLTVDGQEDPHADYGAYEGGAPVYSRVAGLRAKPVKKAKGRSSQAANSLYNMIADAEMFLEMGQRNQLVNMVGNEYQRDPSAFEGLLKIYDEKHPKIVKGKAVKITDEKAFKNGIRGFKNGKPFIIETASNEEGQAVRRAFTNLNPVQLGKWTERFLGVMSFMRGLHTRFNPAFWPREFLRSISDAVGNVYTEKGRKRSAAYGKSAAMKTWKYSWDPATMAGVFSHLINREPGNDNIGFVKALTEEMIVNGGSAGQEFAERAERIAKRMEAELKRLTATGVKAGYFETKEGFNKLLKAVDGVNEFVDLVPRVAAYRALTEAGLTPEQAAPIALRSTLDMTKRGRFGRVIDGLFWWTTPSITNLTKKVTSLDSSTYRKMLIAQLAIGFALGMLNVMNAPDSDDDGEDDYSQLPEWRKLAYLHVYYSPNEKPFTMPVGFLFLFERYVGGKMAEVLAGKTSDAKASVDILTASQDVGAAFLSSLSPVIRSTEARTLAPTSIAPMYDLAINESFFKAPIYNEPFDESEAKASRAKASTPEVYKTIARGLQEATFGYGRVKGGIDVSPDQLKYFVDQYTGGVGRLVGGTADADVDAVKKLNPFYFDPKLVQYSPMSRFYERQPEMKRAVAAEKLSDDGDDSELDFLENTNPVSVDPNLLDAYKDAEKQLKDLRKDAGEMKPAEYKKEQLRIMSEFNKEYNKVKQGR